MLIPIRDKNPPPRIPIMSMVFMVLNAYVFYQQLLGGLQLSIWQNGVIPWELTHFSSVDVPGRFSPCIRAHNLHVSSRRVPPFRWEYAVSLDLRSKCRERAWAIEVRRFLSPLGNHWNDSPCADQSQLHGSGRWSLRRHRRASRRLYPFVPTGKDKNGAVPHHLLPSC